jgi:DNA-binding LacI/PurR family transcriptional regulator
MQLMLSAGHRSIAFFDSYRDELSSQSEESLRAALKSTGCDLPASHIVYGEGGKDGAEQNFHDYERMVERRLLELLSRPNRPTAILAGCDTVAEQVYLATQRLGIRVPEDLSIVCLGGAHRDGAILKRVTAVTIDEMAAGRKAVELLVEMRSGRRSIKDSQLMPLPLSVYPGDTLRPPPTAQ